MRVILTFKNNLDPMLILGWMTSQPNYKNMTKPNYFIEYNSSFWYWETPAL